MEQNGQFYREVDIRGGGSAGVVDTANQFHQDIGQVLDSTAKVLFAILDLIDALLNDEDNAVPDELIEAGKRIRLDLLQGYTDLRD